jgi:hypothetical protein
MKTNFFFIVGLLISLLSPLKSQHYWQQECNYQIEVELFPQKHRMKGKQKLIYTNHSPDTLYKVFYHLYYNAFQPGSEMDERSRNIQDPDPRVGDRISKLKVDEYGWHKIISLQMNQKPQKFETEETILEVSLSNPILPGARVEFEMEFESQVPVQIRRTGRNSAEGIDYSMSQWYPKMCEYDMQGWHANPYVGREFYGIWGDFDVKITLPKSYIVGATGYLQNADEIGYGYEKKGSSIDHSNKTKLSWHFKAYQVHDFFWGADPDYLHETLALDDTTDIHFFYQNDPDYAETWKKSMPILKKAFQFIEKTYGDYPYRQYSFVQGGDGGMEYPMGTLITGKRPLGSLVGVMIHELMHNWYQMLMGTNESLYAWMDEGFTSYSSTVVQNAIQEKKKIGNIHSGSYQGYFETSKSGIEEPLSTHADHFETNTAYGSAAYSKGAVFLHQMEYIIGKEVFDQAMLEYTKQWRFKHPTPNDFIRVMEKVSGLELDWYKEYWMNSIHTIDYAVDKVEKSGANTKIYLQRVESESEISVKNGRMPMPQDLLISYENGKDTSKLLYRIPLDLMRGVKKESTDATIEIAPDWWWTHKNYSLEVELPYTKIISVELDPTMRMADVNRKNNIWKNEK